MLDLALGAAAPLHTWREPRQGAPASIGDRDKRSLDSVRSSGFDPSVEVRGILFDYGGTLDGPASHWLDRFVELYKAAGLDLPFERTKEAFYGADEAAYADRRAAGMSLAELMDFHVAVQLRRLGIDDSELQSRLAREFCQRSRAALAESRAVLARLARRYRLGVASNFYGNVHRILADAGIAPLLTVVADSTQVGCMKPDRRLFEHALAALGTEPAATLHVGDSYERDIRAAHALGLRTAWLVPAERRPAQPDAIADLVICSLDELESALQ
jgi:putative hydrolase of the HAD superfamily